MIDRKNIEWKPVYGNELRYLISNYGDVIRHDGHDIMGRVLRGFEKRFEDMKASTNGYCPISCGTGIKGLHRLVAYTFLGEPPAPNYQVNHKDGNKMNNYVGTSMNNYEDGNLEWVTGSENMVHAYANNLVVLDSPLRKATSQQNVIKAHNAVCKPVVQLQKNGVFLNEYPSVISAAIATGISDAIISYVCLHHNNCKSAGGFMWVYKENYNPNTSYKYSTNIGGHKKPIIQYNQNNEIVAKYISFSDAARKTGYNRGWLRKSCETPGKLYKNCYWKQGK